MKHNQSLCVSVSSLHCVQRSRCSYLSFLSAYQDQLFPGLRTVCELHHLLGGTAHRRVRLAPRLPDAAVHAFLRGLRRLLLCRHVVRLPVQQSPTVSELFIIVNNDKNNTFFPPLSLCSLAMFYTIALAGAHKKVINQLREQLVMVGLNHRGRIIVELCDL